MRKIKFRVFDTKQMKFLEIHDFIDETWQFNGVAGFGNIGVLAYQIRENGELNSKLICDDERFKIEQFTGLYDKDKTEIYEGDILQSIDGGVIREVRFNAFHAMFETVILKSVEEYWIGSVFMLSKYICDNHRVIGNIYENSELLK